MEKRKKKKRVMSILGKVYVVLLFLFIYAPVFVMIVFSFNDSHANVVWSGFTTKYYVKLFSDSGIWEVLGTTLLIAVISTLIGLVVGTTGAVGLRNAKFKGKKLIMNTIYFPIVIPEIVLAVALLLVFNLSNIGLSIGTIIIGNTTLVLPYVYITVKARLVGMDPSIEEASMDLGADRVYTFLHVTLPMKVYSMIKKGISPEINALTTIIFGVCLLGLLAYLIHWMLHAHKVKKVRANAMM